MKSLQWRSPINLKALAKGEIWPLRSLIFSGPATNLQPHCQLIWEMSWLHISEQGPDSIPSPSRWHASTQSLGLRNSLMKRASWSTQLFYMHESCSSSSLFYSQLLRGFPGSRRFAMGQGKQGFRAKCFPETYCLGWGGGVLVLLLKAPPWPYASIPYQVECYCHTGVLAPSISYTLCYPSACMALCPFMRYRLATVGNNLCLWQSSEASKPRWFSLVALRSHCSQSLAHS